MVNKKYKRHTADICKRNKILNFENVINRQIGTQSFKHIKNGKIELLPSSRLQDSRLTRIPNIRGGSKSILVSESTFWNNLPLRIRNIQMEIVFKHELKLYLIECIELSECSHPSCQDHMWQTTLDRWKRRGSPPPSWTP